MYSGVYINLSTGLLQDPMIETEQIIHLTHRFTCVLIHVHTYQNIGILEYMFYAIESDGTHLFPSKTLTYNFGVF